MGGGELVVYRILCPVDVIGSVIGKGGKVINSLRQETQAKITVVDPFPNASKRVITIYCYVNDKDVKEIDPMEEMYPLCPAQDALIRVHAAIANAMDDRDSKKNHEEVQILVPTSQAANIIGKSGDVIKNLRAKTRANISVDPKDPSDASHSCAMSFDNFVLIKGDAEAVKKALYSVSTIMYKFSPKEEISLDAVVPVLPPNIISPSDVSVYPSCNFYPNVGPIVPPYRALPPAMLLDLSEMASPWPVYPSLPAVPPFSGPSHSEELVVKVLCPSDKIGRVIGKGGSAIKYIRQASGALVEVDVTKDESEECVVAVKSMETANDAKSASVEAVLLLQKKINGDDDDAVGLRLLVPAKAIGCLIGKNGSVINEIRKTTQADIRISKGEKPKCASSNEELLEVSGEVDNQREALSQIVKRLREYVLRNRDAGQIAPVTEPMFPGNLNVSPVYPSVPPVAPLGYDQRTESGTSGLGAFIGNYQYWYNLFQAGENAYGAYSSFSSKAYGGLPFTKMPIPSHAVSKVMGKSGANLANIRKKKLTLAQKDHENVTRLSEEQKMQKERESLLEQMLRQQVEKQKLEMEMERLNEQMKENADEFGYLQDSYETLSFKLCTSNDNLQEVRKALITGLKETQTRRATIIGIKRMGELDDKPFEKVCNQRFGKDDADLKAVELSSKWQEEIRNPHWHPYKIIEFDGYFKEIIDEEDERLKELKAEYGDAVHDAVTTALLEMNEYNASGRYVTSELWNFREKREASLGEVVQYLFRQLKTLKRKR